MKRDLSHLVDGNISVKFDAHKTTVTGDAVDLQGCNSVTIFIITGTITDGTHTVSLLESDDDSTYTDVDSGDIIGTPPAIDSDDSDTVFKIAYRGHKRYLKVKVTVAGATDGGNYGAIVVKGHLDHSLAT